MSQSSVTEGTLSVEVRNLGGIDESIVELQEGVNVLSGRNATNRTSFLRALMGALGSDGVSLKADADAGSVILQTASDRYTRRLERRDGTVVRSGDPYLDDSTLADLFAFLLESNEPRQAVARSDNLRELMLRPVDVEQIQAEIDEAVAEKRRLDERIDELQALETKLPEHEAELRELTEEIETLEAELAEKRKAADELDASAETKQAEQDALDERLEELQSVQSELEETRFRRQTEKESLEELRAERDELSSRLDELPAAPTEEIERIERELDTNRRRLSELDSTTSQLQSVIQFNEEMLEGTNPAITEALRAESSELTDQLTESSVVCWTCGSEVDTQDIESTLDRLKTVRQQRLADRRALRAEIDELATQKQSLENATTTRTQLEERLERASDELSTRSQRVDTLSAEIESLRTQARELEAEIDGHEESPNETILEAQSEINQLEFELGRKENERQQLEARIETIEAKQTERQQLEADRADLTDRLTELRTRIDQLETEAVEAFNEHMDAVLDTLGYENLARIWIERSTETVKNGRRTVEESVFRLHIVRQTDDGHTYEDTIDHLSESEREVTGLVFALAGYLVHNVYEEVPVMILDSLEAIDSDRIATLVEYFSEYVETIVVALLPEDAQALDDDYHRVTDI